MSKSKDKPTKKTSQASQTSQTQPESDQDAPKTLPNGEKTAYVEAKDLQPGMQVVRDNMLPWTVIWTRRDVDLHKVTFGIDNNRSQKEVTENEWQMIMVTESSVQASDEEPAAEE